MPNPSTFPIKGLRFDLQRAGGRAEEVALSPEALRTALQYSPTRGLPKLTAWLLEQQRREHAPPEAAAAGLDVAVTTGSQDAFSRALDALVGPGRAVLIESPTYAGALACLEPSGAVLAEVETDGEGLRPDALRAVLQAWDEAARGAPRPRVLYTVPTGCNPTGATLPEIRRRAVYEVAREFDLIILEDDPYYYLQHDASKAVRSLLSMDVDGRVLRFDSFSKILSAGLRLGWATGPKALVERLALHMEATVLHTSGLSQAVAHAMLERWGHDGFGEHVGAVRDFYRQRCDVFLAAAERHLCGLCEWSAPTAGMFVWLRCVGVDDTTQLVMEGAQENKVLFVPGSAFLPGGGKTPSPFVRAAFSTASDEDIDEALRRLAGMLRAARAPNSGGGAGGHSTGCA